MGIPRTVWIIFLFLLEINNNLHLYNTICVHGYRDALDWYLVARGGSGNKDEMHITVTIGVSRMTGYPSALRRSPISHT